MISEGEKSRLQVGFKQTVRALEEEKAEKVYLSEDCAGHMRSRIEDLCAKTGVQLLYAESMAELGRLCEIEVKASCAVILK